ncbi:hypothetical protein ELH93_19605 [Rhizobium leguminosarum]|nr:hypothetical protein ELH93_19605 [Rhizobium leguminosarum]
MDAVISMVASFGRPALRVKSSKDACIIEASNPTAFTPACSTLRSPTFSIDTQQASRGRSPSGRCTRPSPQCPRSLVLSAGALKMIHFEDRNGASVFLNLTLEDGFNDGGPLSVEVRTALARIHRLPLNRTPKESDFAAADFIFDEGVVLSPSHVLKQRRHLNAKICSHFNNLSSFGLQLRERLEDVGAFEFFQHIAERSLASAMMERLISVFSMCTTGLDDPADAPVEMIHQIVDHLRTADGLRWKVDLFGKNPLNFQCASQFVLGLSKIFPDANFEAKARQHRTVVGGKTTWAAFQSQAKDPRRRELLKHFETFKAEFTVDPSKAIRAVTYVANWLDEVEPGKTLSKLSQSKTRATTFSQYMQKRIGAVTQHVVESVKTARAFCDHILENLETDLGRSDFHPLITEREVQTTKNQLLKAPRRRATAAARPLPEKIHWLVRDILDEGEHGWPGRAKIFQVGVLQDGKIRDIYCPVGPTLLRAAFDIPVRMASLRRLDSGEGDVTRFNADTRQWETNDGPLAGYWADVQGQPRDDFETRGYARLVRDPIKDVTGFFINTNKTSDPHVIPWQHDRLHKAFYDLRQWQSKYNPVTAPVGPEDYLDNPKRIAQKTKARMPFVFGLMRLFPTETNPRIGRIINRYELEAMWTEVLREAERRFRSLHPDQPVQLIRREGNGQYRPMYGLHGLRVRGLTDLYRSGMPFEIISKFIAGHATLMMTAYYLKFTPSEIESFINKAAERAQEARQFIDECRTMSLEEARLRTVSLSPTVIQEIIDSGSTFEFCNVDFGFCPWDCTRCDDGGPLLRSSGEDASKATYGPVPGGRNNCILCRHFVSGPPFLVQLTAYGTKLCERREHLAKEEGRIGAEVGELELRYKSGAISKSLFENRLDVLQQQLIAVKDDQIITESSIFNVEILCSSSVKLMEPNGASDGVALVAGSRESVIEYLEVTPFERNVWLTAASRVYPVLSEPRVEDNRDRYIDLMLHNSGFTPPRLMTTVSPAQCRQAMDQYAELLIGRVSRDEIQALASGDLKLQDVGLEGEVRKLLELAISSPVRIEEGRSNNPAIARLVEAV